MGSQCSGETKLQPPLSTAMFYCYNLNYNILTVYNKERPPVETQPQPFRSGPTWPNSTRIQKMLWNRETGETVQVKLPGFRKLEIGNKTCDPTGPTKPVDSMAQNYHQNPHSRKRNLQQMRAQVIFRLVWDFRSRPFSLFLGSFLGAKRARFLTPFEVSIQRENYQSLEIGKGLVWFQPVSARNSAFFWHPKPWNLTPKFPQIGTGFCESGTRREPVGNHREPGGKIRAPPPKAWKLLKMLKMHVFCKFFHIF